MKADVIGLNKVKAGSIDLNDKVFGLEPREDILQRLVRWQLAKRQQGTHSVLTRSEVSYSKKRIARQKGTGNARHGARSAPIFRKGGVYKGPTPRSHAHNLPKKVRALGIKHALSSKYISGNLVVIDKAELSEAKTQTLAALVKKHGWKRTLLIDGTATEINSNLVQAAQNLKDFDVLPSIGVNVYDVLRRDTLVLTKSAVLALEERLR